MAVIAGWASKEWRERQGDTFVPPAERTLLEHLTPARRERSYAIAAIRSATAFAARLS